MRGFPARLLAAALAAVCATSCQRAAQQSSATPASPPRPSNAIATQVDPWVAKNRVIVITDIANEPDDQMSMVRFLVYSNEFDIEGIIAATSTWMRNRVRPDAVQNVIEAYDQVRPNLILNSPDYPATELLRQAVTTGQPSYGIAAVGSGKMSPGAERIIQAVDQGVRRQDPRPLWITVWGGANTLAQALFQVRQTRSAADTAAFVSHLRVYTISDQDDSGPWIRREFPSLFYIANPSTPDGDEYYRATWTGISGDLFYRNGNGADFTTFSRSWVDANVRAKGPMGGLYILPCCIHEGDTPSFLGLINNGLDSFMSPAWGGWGGRYVWRQPYGESRPLWTQGGDSYPGKDSSRDTVTGIDGAQYTSDQATIWRWRTAFQNDFAARMDWTVKDAHHANHNPLVVVNGQAGKSPVTIQVEPGKPVTLDASGTTDPDGDAVTYKWFFYTEAGTGIPGEPVVAGVPVVIGGGGNQAEGGIPSAAGGTAPQPPARLILDRGDGPVIHATLRTPGVAHVILSVEDKGTPSLTSYRRVILRSTPAR